MVRCARMSTFGLRLAPFLVAAAAASAQDASTSWAAPGALADTSTASTVEAARAAARADRNREAAELFRAAIAQAPHRRRELLQEYADQLNYSGRATQAAPLFREALQSPRSHEERLRLLKGLGLALLWSDQPSSARPVLEELLREQPDDRDTARNLGRALSWSGRQREAVAHLQPVVQADPGDQEARVILAQALAWMGRPDRARAALADASGAEARRLVKALDRQQAPRNVADVLRSTQSDELEIRSGRIGHVVSFAQGRGTAGVRVDRILYEREDGRDSAHVTRPMAHGRYRFSDAVEINAEAGQDRIRTRGGEGHDPTVYSSWITWWPSDLWRFDASTNRGTFDNLQSLRLGITARQHGLSADFTPTERERYTLRLARASYSDGNVRRDAQFETEYRWRTHPDAWIGVRHARFDFDRQLDHGYFNPLSFEATQVTLRAAWRPAGPDGRWELAAAVAAGREHARPDGSKPARDGSLRVAWRADLHTRLEARVQRFSSLAFSGGFARTTVGVNLERIW